MGDVQMDLSQTITNTSLLGICMAKCFLFQPPEFDLQFRSIFSADQPNIHPGCISSTGRNGRQSAIPTLTTNIQNNIPVLATAPLAGINLTNSNIGVSNILLPQTSTQNQAAQQLIGGAISPSLFVTTPLTSNNNLGHHQVILNNIQTQMPIQPVYNFRWTKCRIDGIDRFFFDFAAIRTRSVVVAASMNRSSVCRTYITCLHKNI